MKTVTISQLQPMAGYVLVEPAQPETKTASGIILPENDSEKPQYGTVLAVGPAECDCADCGCGSCGYGCGDCDCGHDHEHTEKSEKKTKKSAETDSHECACDCDCEAPVAAGDRVIYKKWGGNEVTIGETEYQFLKFEDILAIIKQK